MAELSLRSAPTTLRVSRIARSAVACEPTAKTMDVIVDALYGRRKPTSRTNVERGRGDVVSFTD